MYVCLESNCKACVWGCSVQKVQKEQEVVTLQKKLQKLESLCRALQEERRNKPASPIPDSAISACS